MHAIGGFDDFSERFTEAINTDSWHKAQNDFNSCCSILLVGNGGNLAVCDHGAIDIARLTNKRAVAPGSGILASSLINDASHDLWVKNWVSICLRGLSETAIKETMIIGVSSSGYSRNICTALDFANERGTKTLLISAKEPRISGDYNKVVLDVNEYHTSEVLTLALMYQIIHGSGFHCPTIEESMRTSQAASDYTQT